MLLGSFELSTPSVYDSLKTPVVCTRGLSVTRTSKGVHQFLNATECTIVKI